jgi:ribosomal protein S18 acetylase RimI-like enzyme
MAEKLPQVHEFWLKRYRDSDPSEHIDMYRVALGDLIDATERKTYKPPRDSKSEDFWNKSGSIGYMDVSVKDVSIPKEGTEPIPNPDNLYILSYQYTEFDRVKALVIHVIGIEPEYRRRGHARFLIHRAENIALEQEVNAITLDSIDNPIMGEFSTKVGYTLFDCGRSAVKRLKSV